jgi:hypothetical protein
VWIIGWEDDAEDIEAEAGANPTTVGRTPETPPAIPKE